MLQQYYSCPNIHASSSCPITHPHMFFLRPLCFLHMPWCHTLNLHCTCTHYVYTIRNHSPLTLSLTLTSSRLFLILLDSKSFQTTLDSIIWLPDHVLSIHCRLIIILTISVQLTLTLAKVCPHSHLITCRTWGQYVVSMLYDVICSRPFYSVLYFCH